MAAYLIPATTGVDAPPHPLAPHEARWQTIVDDLQRVSRPYGTQFTPRDGVIAVRAAG